MKICLVCSSGGHFFELSLLNPAWEGHEYFWVTFQGIDTEHILRDSRNYTAHSLKERNLINFLRDFWLAYRILKKERPAIIISTGTAICFPFFLLAKTRRIKTIYIESMTRSHSLSLTGKLIYAMADEFIVQWPQLESMYKKAKFGGQVL